MVVDEYLDSSIYISFESVKLFFFILLSWEDFFSLLFISSRVLKVLWHGLWCCRCSTISVSHSLNALTLLFFSMLVFPSLCNFIGTCATSWRVSVEILVLLQLPCSMIFSTQSKTCSRFGRIWVGERERERGGKNFDWMKYKSKQQAVEYIQCLSCSQRWNINESERISLRG